MRSSCSWTSTVFSTGSYTTPQSPRLSACKLLNVRASNRRRDWTGLDCTFTSVHFHFISVPVECPQVTIRTIRHTSANRAKPRPVAFSDTGMTATSLCSVRTSHLASVDGGLHDCCSVWCELDLFRESCVLPYLRRVLEVGEGHSREVHRRTMDVRPSMPTSHTPVFSCNV